MSAFGMTGFAALPALIPGKAGGRLPGRMASGLAALMLILGLPAAAHRNGNTYLLGTDRKDLPQYRFAEIIRQSEDRSLLNYGFLDGGFYFAAGSLPETRFFCTLNNDLPEMRQELRSAVSEGKTEFVITRQQKLKDAGKYELADTAEMIFEGRKWTYYLYRRRAGP